MPLSYLSHPENISPDSCSRHRIHFCTCSPTPKNQRPDCFTLGRKFNLKFLSIQRLLLPCIFPHIPHSFCHIVTVIRHTLAFVTAIFIPFAFPVYLTDSATRTLSQVEPCTAVPADPQLRIVPIRHICIFISFIHHSSHGFTLSLRYL